MNCIKLRVGSVLGRGLRGQTNSYNPWRKMILFLLLAVGLGSLAGVALSADLPGQWEPRKSSPTNRQEVSYVQAGGKFYLAGGSTTGLHERYDPATDSWSRVAPLPVPANTKLDHVQGAEVGGKIYYIGGLLKWPDVHDSTVRIYDPATDSFSEGAPMPEGRGRGGGGIAVHGGKIYYAGGLHNGNVVAWFDVYDPKADSWTRLPDMPRARDHFHAAVVDGKFYAIGGRAKAINATTAANDAYDLATGTWRTGLAPLPTPRGGFAAAVVGREILVIGGEGGGVTHNRVEAYDTVANSWRALAPMPTARHGIQAAVCDGGVYVAAGGRTQGGGSPTNVHEAFSLGAPNICGGPPQDTAEPTIRNLKPSGKIRDRTPRIGATVSDADIELSADDIELYVDNRARAFKYFQDTDRLSAVSRRLSYGGHTVKVVATDRSGETTETSRFKVAKRRR
jgi:hypothetical protein